MVLVFSLFLLLFFNIIIAYVGYVIARVFCFIVFILLGVSLLCFIFSLSVMGLSLLYWVGSR